MRMPRREKAALAVFARHPSGRVKTRLVPPLTARQALALHVACVESTVRLAASLPHSVQKWLYLTPARKNSRALPVRFPRRWRLRVQRGNTLGARLQRAREELLKQGYRRVVFIGSDSPTLPPRWLRQALAALARQDAVIGPARDGGFYLVGFRLKDRRPPNTFRAIAWGTPRAFRQMRARLRGAGQRTAVLPRWHDVDSPADLARLRREVRRNRRAQLAPLRAWFRREKSCPG